MLDLDKYMNNSIKMRVFGEELDVLEPTTEMLMKVDAIEQDLTEENMCEKRIETAHLFLNHNKQGFEIKKEEIKKMPFEAIQRMVMEVSKLRYEADKDPN